MVCVLDREQGGAEKLAKAGITLHSVLKVSQVLDYMVKTKVITAEEYQHIRNELANPRKAPTLNGSSKVSWALENRRTELAKNPLNKKLVEIMLKKKTNLCVALDLVSADEVLKVLF